MGRELHFTMLSTQQHFYGRDSLYIPSAKYIKEMDCFCFTSAREKELSNNCVLTTINVSVREPREDKAITSPSNLLYAKTDITLLSEVQKHQFVTAGTWTKLSL